MSVDERFILSSLPSDGTGYVEDGREIFDDDLDDDVVEKNKGNHSCSIVTQFMCILRLSVGKFGVNSFLQGVNFFFICR